MARISALHYSEWSLKRKLFVCMLLLTVLLLAILAAGLMLFGRTTSTGEIYHDALTMQMEVFEKDITTHFDHLAASALSLSGELTSLLEEELAAHRLSFSELTDERNAIADVQRAMLEPLRQRMLQADCSGVFVLLDATLNSALPGAAFSRTGLYLQTDGYHPSEPEICLYRGASDIARSHGVMPHRKWRLEFRTDLFPEYREILSAVSYPPEQSYRITNVFTLPGTSDSALLLTMPLLGEDGTFYGLCGYEIRDSFFRAFHRQPSGLPHLTCLMSTAGGNYLVTSDALSCGGADGYFHTLTEDYAIQKKEGRLTEFRSESFSYVGLTKEVRLSPDGAEHLLAVMIPKSDYDNAFSKSIVQTVLLLVLLLFFTVSFCRYFSRRFLSPLLTALEQIQSNRRSETSSDIPEILDLIAYLDRQEKEHGETIDALEKKHQVSETEKLRLQTEYEEALSSFRRVEDEYNRAQTELRRVQSEIGRLAYSRKSEIDPADYEYFLNGLQTLTKSERSLFEHYLAGRSVPEILALTGIKESTLKYHNHNLLGKLGVSSRKQMLRYAEVMRQQGRDEAQKTEESRSGTTL